MVETNADLIADYLGEAKDYLEQLNEKLMLLGDGVPPPELVNEMFRSAHSLKGLSACFGFERTTMLTHRLENLLSAIKRGDLVPEPVLVRTMFDAVDVLDALTTEISQSGSEQPRSKNMFFNSTRRVAIALRSLPLLRLVELLIRLPPQQARMLCMRLPLTAQLCLR